MSFILLGILNAQAAGGGGAGAYDLLETQILSSSASSVTFTGLGSYSDYKHLQLRMTMLSASGFASGNLRFNGVSTSNNYAHHRLYGNGSDVVSLASTNTSGIEFFYNSNTNIYSATVWDILDFASASKNTTVRGLDAYMATSGSQISLRSGMTLFSSAITSIELSGSSNFATGSRFSIYGIR